MIRDKRGLRRGAAILLALAAGYAMNLGERPFGAPGAHAGMVPQPLFADPSEPDGDEALSGDWLSCFIRARDELLLSERTALELCRGAESVAPVACFEQAREQAGLFDEQGVMLCRCAISVDPATCFVRGVEQTALTREQLVELCSATTERRLWPDCTKVTPRDPY